MKSARAYWERVLKQHGYTEHIGFDCFWNFPRPDSFNHQAWSWFQKDNIVVGVLPMPTPFGASSHNTYAHWPYQAGGIRGRSIDVMIVVNPTTNNYVWLKDFVYSDIVARRVKLMIHATVERTLLPLCLKLGEPYKPVIEQLCKTP